VKDVVKRKRVPVATVTRADLEAGNACELPPAPPQAKCNATPEKSIFQPVYLASPKRTRLDHAYVTEPQSKPDTSTTECQTKQIVVDAAPPPKSTVTESVTPLSPHPSTSESEAEEVNPPKNDEEFNPDDEESDCGEPTTVDPQEDRKFVVFQSCLEELLRFCPNCGSPIISKRKFTIGSLVAYEIECNGGHKLTWRSQPIIHHQPLGNLIIAAAILMTGNTFGKINDFANASNMQLISRSVFQRMQREHLYPVIQEAWQKEKQKTLIEIKSHPHIVLAGDARCDSPGHNAKYGSYSMMHIEGDGVPGSKKIVDFQLLQRSQVISLNMSNTMYFYKINQGTED